MGEIHNHCFAEPYPEDFRNTCNDDRINRVINQDIRKGATLHKVYQVTEVSDKNKFYDEIPRRILVSKKSGTNEETLEDAMYDKVRVGTITNQLKEISLILRGFVHYSPSQNQKSKSTDSLSQNQKSKSTEIAQGHYITFIYLNDNQWLVLDDNNYFIVPAGYAFFLQCKEVFWPTRDLNFIKVIQEAKTLTITIKEGLMNLTGVCVTYGMFMLF